jgi:type VI secretion system protein ImpL
VKTVGDLIRDRGSYDLIFKAVSAIVVLAACGLCWVSYTQNRDFIAQTRTAVTELSQDAGTLAGETTVRDRDLTKVLPSIHRLRYLPAGFAHRDIATPPLATFGLSQRERLQAMSVDLYHVGLERLLRPRLLFRLEEQLNARKTDAAFVYEALKVYLMLGGQHPPDRELIKSWMRRDWAENVYPGESNAEGRRHLEEHLAAMLALEAEEPPLVEVDGRLIEEAQKSLARVNVWQRSYELLKSEARASTRSDWIASQAGGFDASRVFEADQGQPLDTIRVPAFFTYDGFHNQFIAKLPDLPERMKRDRWVLGTAGQQAAANEQYDNLADKLAELYANEFVTTWRNAAQKLKVKKLTADRPRYAALLAVSAPTSPLKLMLESIRDETALTRERASQGAAGANPVASSPSAQGRTYGARIEGSFRSDHAVVDGAEGRRLIDSVIRNLNDIAQSLTLINESPVLGPQANTALQSQIPLLRNNAARMPAPFSDMLRGAAAEFDDEMVAATAEQLLVNLRDQVTAICQPTIGNRYPFTRGSGQDVPIADFSRLFSQNGVLDKFFGQSLAPYADTSGSEWAWRKGATIARTVPASLLKPFQQALQIREAFFQNGGNAPMVVLSVQLPVTSEGGAARIDFGTSRVSAGLYGSEPTNIQWPGSLATAAITVPAIGSSPVLERSGPWAMFRLLEAGALATNGPNTVATFILSGRELKLNIKSEARNPLNLALLRDFRCPGGI